MKFTLVSIRAIRGINSILLKRCRLELLPFFILLFFLSSGCNQNKIIEEEKFIEVYTDIVIVSDTVSETINPKDEVLKKILSKHGVTLDDYKRTIEYYNQESQRWEKFFTKAIAYLEQKRKEKVK